MCRRGSGGPQPPASIDGVSGSMGLTRTATRRTPGTISVISSSRLAPRSAFSEVTPVTFPPGLSQACDQPGANRVDRVDEDDWNGRSRLHRRDSRLHRSHGENHVGLQREQAPAPCRAAEQVDRRASRYSIVRLHSVDITETLPVPGRIS